MEDSGITDAAPFPAQSLRDRRVARAVGAGATVGSALVALLSIVSGGVMLGVRDSSTPTNRIALIVLGSLLIAYGLFRFGTALFTGRATARI